MVLRPNRCGSLIFTSKNSYIHTHAHARTSAFSGSTLQSWQNNSRVHKLVFSILLSEKIHLNRTTFISLSLSRSLYNYSICLFLPFRRSLTQAIQSQTSHPNITRTANVLSSFSRAIEFKAIVLFVSFSKLTFSAQHALIFAHLLELCRN